jgi:hypothetical protein
MEVLWTVRNFLENSNRGIVSSDSLQHVMSEDDSYETEPINRNYNPLEASSSIEADKPLTITDKPSDDEPQQQKFSQLKLSSETAERKREKKEKKLKKEKKTKSKNSAENSPVITRCRTVVVPSTLEKTFANFERLVDKFFANKTEKEGSLEFSGERFILWRGSSLAKDAFLNFEELFFSSVKIMGFT